MLERTIEKGGIFGGDRNIIGGKCEIEKRREKGRERETEGEIRRGGGITRVSE